ncbi:HAD family hydrolase [Olsenella intestinalis]|uniref:HAD family hydrolase n=1 Tax=Olsenella intestinalis TaxID=2930083 RepID=UPI00200E81BD|nr:HAD family hydrolase [Olsenella intestinalis]
MLDLDGTIVSGGTHVSERVRHSLVRAHERGVTLAVSSGRPYHMVPRSIRELGVMDYYVCTNGSVVNDRAGERIFSHGFDPASATRIMGMLEHLRPGWNVFVSDEGYAEVRNHTYMIGGATGAAGAAGAAGSDGAAGAGGGAGALRAVSSVARFALAIVAGPGFHERLSVRGVVRRADQVDKMGCSFASEWAADEACALLSAESSSEVVRMTPLELEITAAGVDKGTGASWLADRLGVSREATVGFGDGANDLPLVGAVGRFVAMGNADDEVKAVASEVCPTIDEDGVAQWLDAHVG